MIDPYRGQASNSYPAVQDPTLTRGGVVRPKSQDHLSIPRIYTHFGQRPPTGILSWIDKTLRSVRYLMTGSSGNMPKYGQKPSNSNPLGWLIGCMALAAPIALTAVFTEAKAAPKVLKEGLENETKHATQPTTPPPLDSPETESGTASATSQSESEQPEPPSVQRQLSSNTRTVSPPKIKPKGVKPVSEELSHSQPSEGTLKTLFPKALLNWPVNTDIPHDELFKGNYGQDNGTACHLFSTIGALVYGKGQSQRMNYLQQFKFHRIDGGFTVTNPGNQVVKIMDGEPAHKGLSTHDPDVNPGVRLLYEAFEKLVQEMPETSSSGQLSKRAFVDASGNARQAFFWESFQLLTGRKPEMADKIALFHESQLPMHRCAPQPLQLRNKSTRALTPIRYDKEGNLQVAPNQEIVCTGNNFIYSIVDHYKHLATVTLDIKPNKSYFGLDEKNGESLHVLVKSEKDKPPVFRLATIATNGDITEPSGTRLYKKTERYPELDAEFIDKAQTQRKLSLNFSNLQGKDAQNRQIQYKIEHDPEAPTTLKEYQETGLHRVRSREEKPKNWIGHEGVYDLHTPAALRDFLQKIKSDPQLEVILTAYRGDLSAGATAGHWKTILPDLSTDTRICLLDNFRPNEREWININDLFSTEGMNIVGVNLNPAHRYKGLKSSNPNDPHTINDTDSNIMFEY